MHLGSRLPVRGAVLMTAFGWLALVRWCCAWCSRGSRPDGAACKDDRRPRTRLAGSRDDSAAHREAFRVHRAGDGGYRAARPRRYRIRDRRLASRARHRPRIDQSQQPHESAHDRVRGGRGGPNARAFAQMANDRACASCWLPRAVIDATTWFVGAQRNTCDNAVTFFDEDLVPAGCRPLFERAREAIETARRREAHERCRRFDAVPRWYPPLAALAHAGARRRSGAAAAGARPRRPNAFCIIGRRTRTRGLFLDRRAFLVSCRSRRDDDGAILARIMAAVVPVVAGISLEYYFSYVDPSWIRLRTSCRTTSRRCSA